MLLEKCYLQANTTTKLFGSQYPRSFSHAIPDLSVAIHVMSSGSAMFQEASAGRCADVSRQSWRALHPMVCTQLISRLPLSSRPGRFPISRHIVRGSWPHHPIFHSQPLAPALLGRLNLRDDGPLKRPHKWHRLQWQHVIIPLHTRPSSTLGCKQVIPPLLFM